MTSYYLSLLGGFDLQNDEHEPVTLTSVKSRAVLAVLAGSRGEAVSRSRLANLLWGDRAEEQAQGSLRQTLSQLRKCLNTGSQETLTFAGGEVCLDANLCRCDLDQFEQLAGSQDAADLAKVVELYRGPLLDGVHVNAAGFEEWLRDERSRLSDSALDAMTRLCRLLEETGKVDQALAVAERITVLDPLREDACCTIMRLHLAAGHSSKAVQAFLKCKLVLADELGLAPSGETQALYEAVLADRQGSAHPAGAANSPVSEVTANNLERLHQDRRPSLVVMPFEDLGGNPDEAYFSAGLTEDIITELSRSPEIIIIARNSAFNLAKSVSPQDICREMGVEYVVKGSIRKTDNQIRVTAQLIEGESGKHIWAERYSQEFDDVLALQEELAQSIVGVLPGRIESFQVRKVIRKPPGSMAAYELLLAGKYHHHCFQKDDCVKALELLDRAIALDPNYAAAHAWKACALGQAVGRGYIPDPANLVRQAEDSASNALRIDENEVEAHRVLAEISIAKQHLEQASYHNDRAMALNPNDPRLLAQKGELATWYGDPQEGAEWIRTAMRLDPFSSPMWAHLLGRALMMSGAYEEAASSFLQNAFPRFGYFAEAAGCYGKLGQVELAKDQAEQTLSMNPAFSVSGYSSSLAFSDSIDTERHAEILSTAPLPA